MLMLAAPLGLLALGLGVLLFDPWGAASAARGSLFDTYQAHASRTDANAPSITIVEIDAAASAQSGAWPWNQARLTQLTQAITSHGARLVVFADPFGSDDGDTNLNNALRAVPAVLPVQLGVAGHAVQAKAKIEYRGRRAPFDDVPRFTTAAAPALESAGLGAVNMLPDTDGVIRRMPSLFDGALPSLAVEAARLLANRPEIIFDSTSVIAATRLTGFEVGGRDIAADSDGGFWLDYTKKIMPRTVTATALLADTINPSALSGAVVIVGGGDRLQTPLGMQSRAHVLAQAIANLATGNVMIRPLLALPGEFLALLISGAATLLLLRRRWMLWAGLFAIASILSGFYASWFFFATRHWLLDAATPSIALFACFAGGALFRLGELHQARMGLRLAFADSLPRASIEKIAHSPGLLTIEGEIRAVTYLVCGVRGLAGLAAHYQHDPKAFTALLQQVLSPLLDQALAHGGTIDRLTADGFAAFWNAPLDDADHALHACEAANGMSIMAARVSEHLAASANGQPVPPLEIGVGIATGKVIAGAFGGQGRLGYSVNGEAPALAARLQALSGQYGPAVIVSDETQAAAARGFAFLEVDMIAAGATDAPVRLYAMLGNPVVRSSPKFRALITFHEHIFQSLRAQQWAKARALIEQCRKLSGASQMLYDLHLSRIRYFETHPPGQEWDGAFRQVIK